MLSMRFSVETIALSVDGSRPMETASTTSRRAISFSGAVEFV
jgi:hypothetical protein